MPVPLPARGGAPPLRGRPPRQEGTQENRARGAADRALERRARGRRRAGGCRLLCRRAFGAYRRRPPTAGRPWPETEGPVGGDCRQSRQGQEKGGLSKPLRRLRDLLRQGLERTAALWPDVRETHRWLHAAAHILGNAADHPATVVQARYDRLIATWSTRRGRAGGLTAAVDHFVKVTASYRPGLFHCYAVPDLPRTNNDLEHLFGCHRHHERRATGRKVASPSLVLRGSVRIVAATATRIAPFTARDLATDQARWLKLRSTLETRRQARGSRTRFRRDQDTYLAVLEDRACQQRLPS
ncbi:transposase (plasmid) [Azospirillum sp. B510]|nr:transposase [Azospirillum sp. B510]